MAVRIRQGVAPREDSGIRNFAWRFGVRADGWCAIRGGKRPTGHLIRSWQFCDDPPLCNAERPLFLRDDECSASFGVSPTGIELSP